jgi:glycosyltransferase involved in cell wall biosynthesis
MSATMPGETAPAGATALITVCVCTFKRPQLLTRLLHEIARQHTDGAFAYRVVVVDNDERQSAREPVEAIRRSAAFDLVYVVEPEQNIAMARNRAVENAAGEYLAFIDDDEFPGPDWLGTMHRALVQYRVDGVLGPVLPHYEQTPPDWIVRGRFHDRPSHASGEILTWTFTRTGNALLKRALFDAPGTRFRPEFGSGGEDRDLFRRLIESGRRFAWCAEAPVYESIPAERLKRGFMLRRALLRGKTPYNHTPRAYLRSAVAIPAYTIALPFLLLSGQHRFMRCLVSYFDHVGRILALLGADVIKDKYVIK